eukprot:22286-Hanusia_phi.AAC.3
MKGMRATVAAETRKHVSADEGGARGEEEGPEMRRGCFDEISMVERSENRNICPTTAGSTPP